MPKLRGLELDRTNRNACLDPIAEIIHEHANGLTEDFRQGARIRSWNLRMARRHVPGAGYMSQTALQSIPVWERTMPGCEELIARATAPELTEEDAYWASLRVCSHIFASIASYDANTGHGVPQSLQQALLVLAREIRDGAPLVMEDNLLRAIDLCHEPLETILAKPRSQLRRMHALRPVSRGAGDGYPVYDLAGAAPGPDGSRENRNESPYSGCPTGAILEHA